MYVLWMITNRKIPPGLSVFCALFCTVAFSAPRGSGQLRADVTLKPPLFRGGGMWRGPQEKVLF